jgi:hypothetical protein
MMTLKQLNNDDLKSLICRCNSNERKATANLVAALSEMDTRKLYLECGFSSLFGYCTEVLNMGEGEAYRRVRLARMSQECDGVLEALAEGKVSLSVLVELAPVATHANVSELLTLCTRKTKRQVLQLLADRQPEPDVKPLIRALPQPEIKPTSPQRQLTPTSARRVKRHAAPLGDRRFSVQFTASAQTEALLRKAQALMSHRQPDGDMDAIFGAALEALCEKLGKEKHGQTERPQKERAQAKRGRHIPAAIRRAVYQRDGGRCAWESGGRRCGDRYMLEYDHVRPWASGGEHAVGNLRLLCRAHNQGRI